MPRTVIVFDLETILDKAAIARVYGLEEGDHDWATKLIGDKFPPHIFHLIVAIGALRATQRDGAWIIDALGAPHFGERDERTLISDFVAAVEKYRPQLVSFNGSSFDLPVLRYRGCLHRISAPGLHSAPYFHRYGDRSVDLCDVLAAYDGRAKVSLDALCKAWGIPGKPADIDGAKVGDCFEAGEIQKVANYCERDVVSTYMIWLASELFAGRLTSDQYARSEAAIAEHITARSKSHLQDFVPKGIFSDLCI